MNTYIIGDIMSKQEKKMKEYSKWGWIITVFFCFGTIGGILNSSEGLRDGLPLYIVCLIPGILLIIKSIKIGKLNDLAYKYDSIFCGDLDGYVTINELQDQTGKSQKQIFDEIDELINKGYFSNLTLHKNSNAGVILGNEKFVNVTCKHCGAATRIRLNTVGKCEYCGSEIKAYQ